MPEPVDSTAFERRVQALAEELLQQQQSAERGQSRRERWINGLLCRLNADPAFRIRLLRFVDVLPSLDDDAGLVRIFHEHFDDGEFPLPGLGNMAVQAGRVFGERALAGIVRHAVEILSRQFLAGRDAAGVFARVTQLQRLGFQVSLDRVGEVTVADAEATHYLEAYLQLIDAAARAGRPPLHLSLKLSSLYARIAPHNLEQATEIVLQRLLTLAGAVRATGGSITLDMEDYDKRPLTLAVFERWVSHPAFADWPGAGIALQAYLREAVHDVHRLLDLARRRAVPFQIRLVRGAYWDQECIRALQQGWPIPVWLHQQETDFTYESCIDLLLGAAPAVSLAVATHNPHSLAYAIARAETLALPAGTLEFQMLYGMARPLQTALRERGLPVRIYLPFGEPIPGMAYLVRRLLENTSSQSVARMGGGTAAIADAPVRPATASAGFTNEPVHRFVAATERIDFAAAIAGVRAQLGGDYGALIDGEPVGAEGWIESCCPADPGLLVGRVAAAGPAEAERAIRAAQRAFPAWSGCTPAARAGVLREAARLLRERRDTFAAWEIFEAGKSWTEADADVCEAIDFLMYYAAEAERLAAGIATTVPGEDNRYHYRPHGIGVVIPPWNFPLAILTGMLSATLVSGNCALLKPSSETPVVAARFVQLLLEAGVPPGALGFLPGPGAEVGEFLVDHPAVHLVAFTGSREVGCRLIQRAAVVRPAQRHVKRVIAEMGGKNAIIVDASADPDEAVTGIVQSAFGFQGQKCSACSRVIVVGHLYSALCERLAQATADLQIALPWEAHCDLGPVISRAARRRLEAFLEQAPVWGRLLHRGTVPANLTGHYVAPAIFADVDPASPLAREELFGPVLALLPADNLEHALAIANDTDYALTGGVYSRSPASLRRVAEAFEVGNLYLNRGITGALVARQPFGGFRLSGIGSKAGGPDYLVQFMQPRCVTENTLRHGAAPW